MAVVEEAIKYCGCHHRIAKHCAPLADAAIAGEQDRALLITAADELEEQVRRVGLEWQITKFINNQELRFAELRKPFFEPTLAVTPGELCNDAGGGNELRRIPGQNRFMEGRLKCKQSAT